MTWQRIDENTYIDDTLVTCAEYQLFIDEMREQGKYYQPDHWTSYQFSAGQALEAILGVRYSDAENFCEWLNKREVKTWRYRLPNQREGNNHLIRFLGVKTSGYWCTSIKTDDRFIWIIMNSSDIYSINHAKELELFFAQIIDQTDDYSLKKSIKIACSLALKRIMPIDIGFVLSDINTLYEDDGILDVLSRRSPNFREMNISFPLSYVLHKVRMAFTNPYGDPFYRVIARFLSHYVELKVLQERIAGRSPAFEGIRLVKERIR